MAVNCGEPIWNLADQVWNDPSGALYWFCLAKRYNGDSDSDTDLIEEEDETVNNVATENYVKLMITLHNNFLTEDQAKFLKLAGAYPSFEERKMIEEDIKAGIEITGDDSLLAPPTDIQVNNIKIGFKQIIEHVSNKSK